MGSFLCLRGLGWASLGALFLYSCAATERHKPKPATPRDERVELLIAELASKRVDLAAASDPVTGWPSASSCDGLLWAGLAAAAGAPVNLAAAEYAPGEMHRRPPPPCWSEAEGDQGSKSTVSRDMLTGYLWGLWRDRDGAAARRLASFGEAHQWVMGEGDPFRTDMRSNLKGLLGRILAELGFGLPEYRLLPAFHLAGGKDYERHLAVLGVLLEGEVTGSISGDQLAVVKADADDSPGDALFQTARGVFDGDMSHALDLLLDPAYQAPSYVRGGDAYPLVHWVFAADMVVRRFNEL